MKIRHRAMLLGMLPALLVTLLLGGYLIHARLADLQAGLHARGQAVAGNLAQGALYSVVSGNRAPLEGLLQQTLQHADVVYAAGYRLSVRSRPRRGTLFSLAIPRLAEAPAEAPVEAACMDPSRLRGLVALVDDDRLILDALPPARQLGSGGGGGAGRRGLLARLSRAPDLLITDYRLAGGESGLDMVERVTAVHGPLPVVIVTGDTARDSLAEIAAHGHPVLHKPVHPAAPAGRAAATAGHVLPGLRPSAAVARRWAVFPTPPYNVTFLNSSGNVEIPCRSGFGSRGGVSGVGLKPDLQGDFGR